MSDDKDYLNIPPAPGQRVTQLFAWIAIHPDGGEGIMSTDMPLGDLGMRHMPLITSKREVAEKMRPIAEQTASQASTAAGAPVAIVLRSFWS
jgi:hypothetical protein